MFEYIVSKIATVIRNTAGAVAAATHRTPWLALLTLVALIMIW